MQDKNFEEQVQDALSGFAMQPNDVVWEDIASVLKKEKKRRGIIWFFFLFGFLLLGTSIIYFSNGLTESPSTSTGNQIKKPSLSVPLQEVIAKDKVEIKKDSNKKQAIPIKYHINKSVFISSEYTGLNQEVNIPVVNQEVEKIEEGERVRERASLIPLYNKPNLATPHLIAENTGLIKREDTVVKKNKKWEWSVFGGGGIHIAALSTNDLSIANNLFAAPAFVPGGAGTGGIIAPSSIVFKNGKFFQLGMLATKPISRKVGLVFGADYTFLLQYARYNSQTTFTKDYAHFLQAKAGGYLQFNFFGKNNARFVNTIGYGQFIGESPFRKQQFVVNSGIDIGLNKKQNLWIGSGINYHLSPSFVNGDKSNHLKRIGLNLRWVISKN